MQRHASRARLLPAIVLLASLCGCALPDRNPPARVPVMPTVGMPSTAPRADEREQLAGLIALVRADRVTAAMDALTTTRDPAVRAKLGAALVAALADEPPERLAAVAVALPANASQGAALDLAGRAYARRDPAAAVRWALALPDAALVAPAGRAAIAQWAETDARVAAEHLVALPEGAAREELLAFAVSAWARRDAEQALAWSRATSDAVRRERLVLAVGFTLAQTRPQRAVELAESLPQGRDRLLLFSAAAQTWVAGDRPAALDWAGRLREGAERDAAFAGIETGLGVPSTRRRGGAPGQRSIRARGLGGGGPAGIEELPGFDAWLATQPAARDREEALIEFVRQRGALDTGAIGQGLAALPPSPARDRALAIYLEGRLGASPADAAAWLRSLPRSDVNDGMVEQVARRWLLSNPEVAETWLRETPIPDYLKDRILREAGR
ncbi:MAG: hypothetical protein Q8N18_14210 [Opitutaceae bacterium]|nr:hypothetical protein [Opitutaceae bacterium]